jgi:hypothetical protein
MMRISRAVPMAAVMVVVLGSTWMAADRMAVGQEGQRASRGEARPKGALLRLPAAGTTPQTGLVEFPVPQEGLIEIDVTYPILQLGTVKARVEPAGPVAIRDFRVVSQVQVVDGEAKTNVGEGRAVAVFEARQRGDATIRIDAGRGTYLYKIRVQAPVRAPSPAPAD